jgi:hypothetical protein
MQALSAFAELKECPPGVPPFGSTSVVTLKAAIEGLKDIHVTLQFAQLGDMWLPVTFDGIATVRFLGQYTLAGLNIRSSESISTGPK